ncbi:MAG: HNH endonuclease signature motif containing protein [Pyrinomonadaceae bacterium]
MKNQKKNEKQSQKLRIRVGEGITVYVFLDTWHWKLSRKAWMVSVYDKPKNYSVGRYATMHAADAVAEFTAGCCKSLTFPADIQILRNKVREWAVENKYADNRADKYADAQVGAERINNKGCVEVKVADCKFWKLKHRIVWEAAHGTLPEKAKLYFIDGNKLNCSLENLTLSRIVKKENRRSFTKEFWTEERLDRLRELYPDNNSRFLTESFGVSARSIRAAATSLSLSKSNEFWAGLGERASGHSRSRNVELLESIDEKYGITARGVKFHRGFLCVKMGGAHTYVRLQNLIWEKRRGMVPEGFRVTFKDFNPFNCDISNLELVTSEEFSLRRGLLNCPPEMHPVAEVLIELRRELQTKSRSGSCKRISWSDEDIEFLKANYCKTANKAIATHLRRSLNSVTAKAAELGLTNRKYGRKWADEDIENFKQLYPTTMNRKLIKIFGFSRASIIRKAMELGLTNKGKQGRKLEF